MRHQNKQLAFVFPGQGSQQLGMLAAYAQYPQVQAIFAQASDALGKDLWSLAQNGPESELHNTVNTQPLLLTAGVALWEVWKSLDGPIPSLLAGHSLGEYTALVCANALSLTDGVKLVSQRGQFMQEAVPMGMGAMAAVLGLDNAILETVCQEASLGEVVSPVNFNAIGQTVIAGTKTAVERASALAKARGAKRVIPLPVSVPSHCALMRPAAKALMEALTHVKISTPTIPIIHNVTVDMSHHPDDIRELLTTQLYQPVRWVETIQRFATEGIETTIECGPGKVLSTLSKRIEPAPKAMSIETPADLTQSLTSFH